MKVYKPYAFAKDRLYQALATFKPYENQYGLVE